jgi:hypothetical protein
LEQLVSDDRFPIPLAPIIALAIAVVGVVTLLLVDHGPWNRPAIVAASAIAKAEQKAGVTVVPTVPPSFDHPATHHVRID